MYQGATLTNLAWAALKATFKTMFKTSLKFLSGAIARQLNEAISLYEEALRLCPVEHKYCHFSLDKLGGALLARFNQRGDVNDIISLRREALTLCSLGNPSRHSTLSNPALRTRYVKLNTGGDLDESINLFQDWLRET
ncbi:hypothetical protein BD769DRAFT_1641183 [Suillus cothurnatus]|nr:hypothetical protein BD769DRAFT_1641183 [Suillus cothurnatus]